MSAVSKVSEVKVLELKFLEDDDCYKVILFYNDGSTDEMFTHYLPKNIVLGRHYSITDIYGNSVIDDRKGL